MCGYTQKDEGIKQTWQNIKICRSSVKGIKICNLCQNLKLFQNKKLWKINPMLHDTHVSIGKKFWWEKNLEYKEFEY